jgi:predicted RNase H-like HicB family nuclease
MKYYPAIIHKDKDSAFGVTLPDLPGCFSAGDTLDDALRNVQEAVEVHMHGEDIAPEPSTVDHWKKQPASRNAFALTLVPVDLSFMNDSTVRINITARKSELAVVDRAAKRANMDRSAYLVTSAIAVARKGAGEKR